MQVTENVIGMLQKSKKRLTDEGDQILHRRKLRKRNFRSAFGDAVVKIRFFKSGTKIPK